MTTLRTQITSLQATMDTLGVDRVTVSDHGVLVKIGYKAFMGMFSGRTDCQRLGGEIRCTEDGITFCSEVIKDYEAKGIVEVEEVL